MSHFTEAIPFSYARISTPDDTDRQPPAFRVASNALALPQNTAESLKTNHSGRNGYLEAPTFASVGKQRLARKPNQEKAAVDKSNSFKPERQSTTTRAQIQLASTNFPMREERKKSTRSREQPLLSVAGLIPATKPLPVRETGMLFESALQKPSNPQDTRRANLSKNQHPDDSPILPTTTLVKLFELQSGQSSSPLNKINPRTEKNIPRIPSTAATAPSVAGMSSGVLKSTKTPGDIINRNKSIQPVLQLPSDSLSNTWEVMGSMVADQVVAQPERPKPTISINDATPTPSNQRRTHQDSVLTMQNEEKRLNFRNAPGKSPLASPYSSAADKFVVRAPEYFEKSKPFINSSLSSHPNRPSRPTARGSDKDVSVWSSGRLSRDGLLHPRNSAPQLTADSLANAMVASSLASSRAPSPSKPPLPPPRRTGKQHSLFRRSQSQDQVQSRTPSPGRTMRQTMRKSPKPDDEDECRRKGINLLKKHPNKHHEGDRKRWRDEITEQERKRYEGVWAANRGLFMSFQGMDSAGTVLNIVVRDIWRRSRLPDDVLEEVWDLVDNERVGRLRKDEFVVGMWLIDQSLKGRKLPMRVSESVWFSARALSGIKVSKSHR